MDTKTNRTTIIKHWDNAHEDEQSALTGVETSNVIKHNEVENDGNSKNFKSRSGILKNALLWKTRNPAKTVLISAACALFLLGITSFVIMHEILGRNIPSSFRNLTRQYESTHRHDIIANRNASFENAINGHWIEDYDQRENMDSYLFQMGMAWFKRSYASSVSWEDELVISVEDGKLTMNGLRGPFAEAYEYVAKLDNQTINRMDIGDFGGITNAITEIENNSMISYVFKPDSSTEIFFVVRNTIDILNDVDVMKVEYTHFSSNVVWKSVFQRSFGDDKENENAENYDDLWEDDEDWK